VIGTDNIIALLDLTPENFWKIVQEIAMAESAGVDTIKDARGVVNFAIQEVIEEELNSSLIKIFGDMEPSVFVSIDFKEYKRFELCPEHLDCMAAVIASK